MSEPTIHKAFFEHNFTCLYHLSAEDEHLSFQAKGLLWYMLSRPANWVIHRKQLATVYKGERKDNGLDAINRMCDELIARGYLIYTKQDPITGKIIHRYDVYPVPYETFKVMFPQRDIPSMDIPTTDNSTPITRKESKTRKEEEMSVTGLSPVWKVSFKTKDKKAKTIDNSEVFHRITKEKYECTTSEVDYAMKALENCNSIVYDWWSFIKGTIEKHRNKKKSEIITKCSKKQKQTKNSKRSVSEEDTEMPVCPPLRSLTEAMKRLQDG